jgi:hypothetical protein
MLYTQLWQRRDKFEHVKINKLTIRKDFLISPTLFRNLLSPLMYLNVIKFTEDDHHYSIEIMGPLTYV